MNRTDTCLALACAFTFAVIWGSTVARGQERHEGHAEFHDVYVDWLQPPPNETLRCCDAKYDHHNNLIKGGDCYATIAEPRPTGPDGKLVWWAKRDTGDWVPVPRARIINELNPDETGTRAHLCENFELGGGVLCFLPPTGGS